MDADDTLVDGLAHTVEANVDGARTPSGPVVRVIDGTLVVDMYNGGIVWDTWVVNNSIDFAQESAQIVDLDDSSSNRKAFGFTAGHAIMHFATCQAGDQLCPPRAR